jgi:hypothetical protein
MRNAVADEDVLELVDVLVDVPEELAPRRRMTLWGIARAIWRGIFSAADWAFGLASVVIGLSVLAALPIAQFLSMGYFLDSSARVARSGRVRDGFIGIRRAAQVGRLVIGIWLCTLPVGLIDSLARTAELIDPGGKVARGWRFGFAVVTVCTLCHIALACLRGGRLRYFLWPFGNPFWLFRRLGQGGVYTEARDGLWKYVVALRLPYYFRLGLIGFVGTLAWLLIPASLIMAGGRFPLLGVIGVLSLAIVAPWLPYLQVTFAVEGRPSALFSLRAVRDRFRRAPWAFAFALLVMLLGSIPLYLLKIEMVPREAAWLPSLVFVAFLAPARLLVGWAYARSERREQPRHWLFRVLGRLAIVPAAAFYVLVVFLAQYTSWGGYLSLYEQHAFLLPVPFLNM